MACLERRYPIFTKIKAIAVAEQTTAVPTRVLLKHETLEILLDQLAHMDL